MPTFSDSRGREWMVTIDTSAIRRAKESSGLYLVDLIAGDDAETLFKRLARDPCLVVDVAWGVCQPAAAAAKIERPEFDAALVGDAIDAARHAILEGLVAFFPSRFREVLPTRPPDADPSAPGNSSGDLPASSESTPAP